MIRRSVTIGLSALTAWVALPLMTANTAFAAGGHFRYSHGEPLNDLRFTPGAIFSVSAATVCRSGYATSVRNVSQSKKYAVYAEYGISQHPAYIYEIDHLIALELGGNNAVANLWPELNDHPRGYLNSKDRLENRLHALVCSGLLTLHSAQAQISSNWVVTYRRYFGVWPHGGTPTVVALPTTTPVTTPSGSSGVHITSLIATAAPGSDETLSAHSSRSHDSCDLEVVLPSGRQSTSEGLGMTSADAKGNATWTWRIGSRTGAGSAHATVTCGAGGASATFVVT